MALTLTQQFMHTVQQARQPLIVLPHAASVDHYTCALTLSRVMKGLGKETEICTTAGDLPKSLHFLHSGELIKGDLQQLKKMTIKIDTKDTRIDEFSYDNENETLSIHLLPKSGTWEKDDVQIETEDYRFDLVITIGAKDLVQLGSLYERYSDFFHRTPIVNIDHHSDNEHFGHINFVDMTATSTTEVCHDLLCKVDEKIVDKDIANLLLTGMIHNTKSFKSPNISPKTLKVAGALIDKGADRDRIVRELYKTRSVSTLRLWGRALARLKADDDHNLTWTLITKQDFSAAGSDASALEHIVDELLSTTPKTEVAVILFETAGEVEALVHAERPYDALALTSAFSGSGTREWARVHCKTDDIVNAERNIIRHIKTELTKLSSHR
jgi:nanoRNase/pAp phosphatase (c-di-AMP/oligoRNAs hydrolase)